MATRKQIEELKAQWVADDCWDIEDTEGFEAHRDELLAFRKEMEAKWEAEYQEELRTYAQVIGCSANLQLAQHLMELTRRITELETLTQLKL
jgi:hypothetical protein